MSGTASPALTGRGKYRAIILVLLGLVGYGILLTRLGFILSTTFLIIYQAWILEARQWLRNIILGAFFSTAVYFIFVRLLNILLPAGILG